MYKNTLKILGLFLLIGLINCSGKQIQENPETLVTASNEFNAYWYAGKAEISAYELQQARYGEYHEGEAVLVFVTEDFLKEKQVKDEGISRKASESVLKLNFIRKFPTGVYDYSMMTSTFSPVKFNGLSEAVKSSTSSQEWCGHSWMQLNLRKDKYQLSSYSYFESEGDLNQSLELNTLEDALWTQIRLAPDKIPLGKQAIIPSAHYLRFAHREVKAYLADVSMQEYLKEDMPGDQLKALKINYPELNRSIEIVYEGEFPYRIAGWKEERKSGFGAAAKTMTTVARRKSQILSPYWSKNSNKDANLRDELKLIK